MKTVLAALCACLALGLVVAGCGNDDNESASGPSTQNQPTPPSATEAEPPGKGGTSARVSMKDITFQPASVTVAKGTTVTWTNRDSVPHDVTKTGGPGPAFNSGEAGGMAKGDTFDQTFTTPGEVKYVCRVHLGMEGTVTVR